MRLDVLRSALGGGAADLPGCDADSLSSASTQFIDDMEEQEVVADRCGQLLRNLCDLPSLCPPLCLLALSYPAPSPGSYWHGSASCVRRCAGSALKPTSLPVGYEPGTEGRHPHQQARLTAASSPRGRRLPVATRVLPISFAPTCPSGRRPSSTSWWLSMSPTCGWDS